MFEVEDGLWWYRGLRLFLHDAVRRAGLPGRPLVLDAGCGSGATSASLTRTGARLASCDMSEEALRFARLRGVKPLVGADVNALPFRTGVFDAAVCADVFECVEVDEARAARELVRVVRPGGRLIVAVAAYQFLLSEHDAAVHSVRRYTKARARAAFALPGTRLVRAAYLFAPFFPAVLAYRLARRLRRSARGAPTSDLFMPPRAVNAALLAVVAAERALARVVPMPFGTTLLLELQRV
jgi:SAM-dependent methyltransferase